MTIAFDQAEEDRKRLAVILRSGHCPECGQQSFQEPPAINETMVLSCMSCGATFMIDLCKEAWV